MIDMMIRLKNTEIPSLSGNSISSFLGITVFVIRYPGINNRNGTHNPNHNGITLNGGTLIPKKLTKQ